MRLFRTLLILVLLNACGHLWAQTLSVESFRLLPNDLTANTYGTMEYDQNGEVAALIKVVTSETGFVFDGGMLGIVKTVQKTGEIWVYVPYGLQKITILHQRLGVLRDYYFDLPIEKALTYELKLSTAVVRTVIEDHSSARFVTFTVEPKNALVAIDDISYPLNADGVMRQLMAKGTHTYRVDAPGYFPETRNFTVNDEDVSMTIVLESLEGTVHLECEMADADIYVNNEFVGKGSWTGKLAPAMYQVEARHEGYRAVTTSFALQVQEERTVSVPTPLPIYGVVSFTSTPNGASVYMDGTLVGQTPFRKDDMLTGGHNVEFRLEGYNSVSTTLEVVEGQTTSYNAILNAEFSASIHSNPEGASLQINGLSRGTTPMNVRLTPGDYELRLSKSGYETIQRKVHLDALNPEQVIKLKYHRFRASQFYLAGFMQPGDVKAFGGQIGFYVANVNFELGYSKPLADEQTIYWLPASEQSVLSAGSFNYKYDANISLNIGVGLRLGRCIRITPQLGAAFYIIREKDYEGDSGSYQDQNLNSTDGMVSLRMEISPVRHVSVFATPTYCIPWKRNEVIDQINSYTHAFDDWRSDWVVKAGVELYF